MTCAAAQDPAWHGEHLVLYDGVCGLCNRLNAFLLRHDSRGAFDFASLQSRTAQALLRRLGERSTGSDVRLDTFYVVRDYRTATPALLSRSRAALFALRALGGGWRAVRLLSLLPTRLVDAGYDLIARNRYRWFGRYDVCLMPDPRYVSRFIDV